MVSEIKKAENLPEKFYTFYEIENPKSLTNDLNSLLFYGILNSNYKKPPSSEVTAMSEISLGKSNSKRNYKLLQISLSWKIENQTSQRECLNWVTENCGFLFQCTGLKQASNFYFNKEIEELNDRELASFVIMMDNPRLYNPKRRRGIEPLNKKVDLLITLANNMYN